MKKLLTFLTLLTLFFGVSWAGVETIDLSQQGFTNAQTVSNVTGTTVSLAFTDGSTATAYYNTGSAVRIYGGGSVTVTAGNNTITAITFTFSASSNAPSTDNYTVDCGTFTPDGTTSTWSGSANSVKLSRKSGNGHWRLKKVEVYYSGGTTVATPTFSPAAGTYYEAQSVTLSCSTPGSTIHYTTDGTNPTTESTVFSGAIPVSSTTTIKAIATADGMDPSPVASATYTIYEPETVTPTYEQSLINGFGKFYFVDKTNPTTTAVWKSNSYGAVASGRISNSNQSTESWLYSPFIDLTSATNPEVSFSHAGNFFQTYMQTDAQVKVRVLNGTEWSEWSDLAISTWPNGTSWDFVDNTTSLSTYAGKKIQIAFRYTSSTSRAGSWEIKNFKIKNVDASAPSYYLVGSFNMNGNAWVTNDDNYKFEESNGTFTLNNVNLPANTEFKIIKIDNGTTWYGGTGDGVYSINHSNYNGLPMNGSQNYKIQSEGVTSFSFSVNNNTPSNLIVSRTAKLYIKGDFNSWNEEAMTATADGWTTTKEIAANNNFGFIDEFGQYFSKEWTIKEEHLNGYEIPMEPSSKNYVMQDGGTYTLNVNSTLTKLTVNKIEAGDNYTLVTSVADLDETSEYVLFPKGSNNESGRVMSTTRQTNNIKGSETVTTVINNEISVPADAQVITLVKTTATVDGDDVDAWFLSVGDGYLYAASNSKNYMKVSTNADDKCKATISINGAAEIIFRGDFSHNVLRYNTGDNLYSCYESGKQDPVYLYKKGASTPSDKVATPVINPGSANSSNPYIVYGGKQQVAITCATEGATVYYTINGDEPTTSSIQYTGEPFDLTSTGGNVTVKAIAVKADMDDSEIATSYYRFTNPNPPTFNPASGTVHNDAFNVTISSEYEDAVIYYMLDPASAPTAAQMSESGTLYENPVNVSGEGSHTIYAMVVRNGIKSSVVNATYTITSGGQPSGDGDYVKVTTATDLTDGEYLIVYEMEGTPIENGIVFDGSLSNLDTKPNSISEVVGINNFTIASSTEVDAAIFTITSSENGYSIKSASDKYIGGTSGSNTMTSSDDVIYNSISFDEDGNADIISNTSHLRYNTSDTRFRYFKSSSYASQQPIALYKKVENPVDEPTEVTLAELCATGVTTDGENWYVISDMLKAVYADDVRGLLWCKDLGNQSIDATSIHDGDQIDFLYNDTQAQNKRDWDQSNWIVLEFTTPDQGNNIGLMLTNAQDKLIKPGTIKGKLINNVNYTLKMDLDMIETLTPADEGYSEEPYEENVYCPSNFLPENLNIWGSIENGDGAYTGQNPQNFFFMNPKVQEVCYITYAEWNQEKNCFTVPTGSGFKGAFQVGWAYKTSQQVPTLHDGKVYNFHAVVQRTDKEHYGPNNPISAKDELPYSEYITVLPVDLTGDDNIITAINTVEAGKGEVKSVKYVNVAGMVSDVPFQGVNIVVTEYTDGTRTTSKMLRK